MGWLVSSLDTPTGARWSAGAQWAEDGNPQADDSDWEDATNWPKTYPATAELHKLGVYIDGELVNDELVSASWNLGTDDMLAQAVPVSSASVTLNADPGDIIGKRLAILTEYDQLWYGVIENEDAPQAPGTPRRWTYSATDDLAKGTRDSYTGRAGGPFTGAVRTLLDAADIGVPIYSEFPPDILDFAYLSVGVRDGQVLSLVSASIWWSSGMGAWAPRHGLRVRPRILAWHADSPWWDDPSTKGGYPAAMSTIYLDDARDAAAEWTESKRVSDVHNDWTTAEWAGGGGDRIRDLDSQAAYGRRADVLDGSTYWNANGLPDEIMVQALGYNFPDPIVRVTGTYNITDTDDTAQRVIPFDRLRQDSTDYMALIVSHELTPESWRVSIGAVASQAMIYPWPPTPPSAAGCTAMPGDIVPGCTILGDVT